MMRHDGATRSGGSAPWLGLFLTFVLAVIGVIAGLSTIGRPVLEPTQINFEAPQVPAPAAPTAMR